MYFYIAIIIWQCWKINSVKKVWNMYSLEVKSLTKDYDSGCGVFDVNKELKEDIIDICFAIVTIDGKLSLKERIYMKKLFSV